MKTLQASTAGELTTAIANAKNGDTIKLTASITGNINLTKLANIDLNGQTLTGSVTIYSNDTGIVNLSAGIITGDLTVNIPNVTFNTAATVQGTTDIANISNNTFNNTGTLGKLIISDPDGGSFNNQGTTGDITISPSVAATAPVFLKGIISSPVNVTGANQPMVNVEARLEGVLTVDAPNTALNVHAQAQIDKPMAINQSITLTSEKSIPAKIANGKEVSLKANENSTAEKIQGNGEEKTIVSKDAKKSNISTVVLSQDGDKIIKSITSEGTKATIVLKNLKDIKVIDFLDSIKSSDDSIQDYDVVGRKVDTMGQIFQGRKSPFFDFMEVGDEFRVRSQDRTTNLTYHIEIEEQEAPKSSRATITVPSAQNPIVTDIKNNTFSKTIDVVGGATGTQLLEQIESTDGSDQTYEIYEVIANKGTLLDNSVKLVQGYVLRVTAADGKTIEDYTINVAKEVIKSGSAAIKSTNTEIVKEVGAIQAGTPLTARILVARNRTVGDLLRSISSTDKSNQSYKVTGTSDEVMKNTDLLRENGVPNYLIVTSEDGKTVVRYGIDLVAKPATNPIVVNGKEAQEGTATPASNDGKIAAEEYTSNVSKSFESASAVKYSVVSAKDQDNNDVCASVTINEDTGEITYLPLGDQGGKTVTIEVKASVGEFDSTGNVTIIVSVGAVPTEEVEETLSNNVGVTGIDTKLVAKIVDDKIYLKVGFMGVSVKEVKTQLRSSDGTAQTYIFSNAAGVVLTDSQSVATNGNTKIEVIAEDGKTTKIYTFLKN